MDELTIRRATRDDAPEVARFWSELIATQDLRRPVRGGPAPGDEQRFLRQFENPFAPEGASWLALEGGTVFGHLAAVACPVYQRGERIESSWWQDFFVLRDPSRESGGSAGGLLALNVRRQPFGDCVLGTPGSESAVARLYRAMGFTMHGKAPFYFLPLRPGRVMRELGPLRSLPPLRTAARLASHLAAPSLLVSAAQWVRGYRRVGPVVQGSAVAPFDRWDAADDALWETARVRFAVIHDRSAAYLNWRYREDAYDRLRVSHRGRYRGWVVCKATRMVESPYLGRLHVGTLVDVLSDPDDPAAARRVLAAGVSHLRDREVDIVLGNFSHSVYRSALRSLGFWRGPSNLLFFSRGLPDAPLSERHLTRGDSDADNHL